MQISDDEQWMNDEFDFLVEEIKAEEQEQMGAVTGVLLLGMYHNSHFDKTQRVRPLETAHEFVIRNLSDLVHCKNLFRMSPPLFHHLHDLLVASYGLESTNNSTSIEALGMFLWMVGAPQSFRQAMTTVSYTHLTLPTKP